MALRTSTQVMSAMLTVDGSGAVSGRSATATAMAAPATTLIASFAGDRRRAQPASGAARRRMQPTSRDITSRDMAMSPRDQYFNERSMLSWQGLLSASLI